VFSKDGELLATIADWDKDENRIIVRKAKEWSQHAQIDVPHSAMTLCFGNDGKSLLIGCEQGLVLIYDLESAEILWKFQTGTGSEANNCVKAIRMLPMAYHCIAGDKVGNLRVADLRTKNTWLLPKVPADYHVSTIAVSPTGRHVLVGYWSTRVAIWRTADLGRPSSPGGSQPRELTTKPSQAE
jgi:WD40 repeat protein